MFRLRPDVELSPHPSHASADVDSRALAWAARGGTLGGDWPIRPFEQGEQLLGYETRPRCINMSVTLGMLTVGKEALWHHEMKAILCPRHRDVKQAALLLELGGRPGSKV